MYICEICGFNISNFADIVDYYSLNKPSEKVTFVIVADFCFGKVHVYMEDVSDFAVALAAVDFKDCLNSLAFQ